jgi:ribosomal subunit interface protein
MDVTITTRHCTVPEPTRRLAEQRISRITRLEPRAATALIAFQTDHGEKQAETRVAVHGGGVLAAHGAGSTFREALARSVERLERQLRRRRERSLQRRPSPPQVTETLEPESSEQT